MIVETLPMIIEISAVDSRDIVETLPMIIERDSSR